VLHIEEIYNTHQEIRFRQYQFLYCLKNLLRMAKEPIESSKLAQVLMSMVKKNLTKATTYDIAKFLQIAHHPMAQSLIDAESKLLLTADIANRVTLYKAPIYLACTLFDPIPETARARTLLNKVATFTRATPTDLNVVVKRAFDMAIAKDEDLAEIGSHFYSRMMRKVSQAEANAEDKERR
jgi:hypothetical protein